MIDLDAYLNRIACTGPRTPTLGVLQAICAAHPAAIAFENIDPLLGRPPSLAPEALHAKLIAQRRGGYCYEQNAVLRLALQQLGFQVTGLAARVVWMTPPEVAPRARSHMLLKVELPDAPQDSFIVDAGFGGRLIGAPLRLQAGLVQATPSGNERITQDAEGYAVEADLGASGIGWAPRYRFTLEPHRPVDYEPLNWFTATYPRSLRSSCQPAERPPDAEARRFSAAGTPHRERDRLRPGPRLGVRPAAAGAGRRTVRARTEGSRWRVRVRALADFYAPAVRHRASSMAARRPCTSAKPEAATSRAPASRTGNVPCISAPPAPRRRNHSDGASHRPSADVAPNAAITPAPCAGPLASAATIRADCNRPQGIAAQHMPSAAARVVTGTRATKRTGCASISRLPWRPRPASQAGARPRHSKLNPSAMAPT
jgi:N-hydroxyarylamine O-acetyltransferase